MKSPRAIVFTLMSAAAAVSWFPTSIQAEVLYVKADATGGNNGTSWVHAFADLQDALAAANAGDEIWVVAGTYTPAGPGGNRNATFQLETGIELHGGFEGTETEREQSDPTANPTILSGDLNRDDVAGPFNPFHFTHFENSYTVVTGSGAATTAILNGFIITGGNANGPLDPESRFTPRLEGGGMFVFTGAPTVRNCVFRQNAAVPATGESVYEGSGAVAGGGAVFNLLSSPTFENCVFRGNVAGDVGGAIYNTDQANPRLIDCTFDGNSADVGGAIFNGNGRDLFRRQEGRGSSPTLSRCLFTGNKATFDGGGLNNVWSDPTLTACTFIGNEASGVGGGIANIRSAPSLVDCIFSGNSAGRSGGSMFNLNGSNLTLTGE